MPERNSSHISHLPVSPQKLAKLVSVGVIFPLYSTSAGRLSGTTSPCGAHSVRWRRLLAIRRPLVQPRRAARLCFRTSVVGNAGVFWFTSTRTIRLMISCWQSQKSPMIERGKASTRKTCLETGVTPLLRPIQHDSETSSPPAPSTVCYSCPRPLCRVRAIA